MTTCRAGTASKATLAAALMICSAALVSCGEAGHPVFRSDAEAAAAVQEAFGPSVLVEREASYRMPFARDENRSGAPQSPGLAFASFNPFTSPLAKGYRPVWTVCSLSGELFDVTSSTTQLNIDGTNLGRYVRGGLSCDWPQRKLAGISPVIARAAEDMSAAGGKLKYDRDGAVFYFHCSSAEQIAVASAAASEIDSAAAIDVSRERYDEVFGNWPRFIVRSGLDDYADVPLSGSGEQRLAEGDLADAAMAKWNFVAGSLNARRDEIRRGLEEIGTLKVKRGDKIHVPLCSVSKEEAEALWRLAESEGDDVYISAVLDFDMDTGDVSLRGYAGLTCAKGERIIKIALSDIDGTVPEDQWVEIRIIVE